MIFSLSRLRRVAMIAALSCGFASFAHAETLRVVQGSHPLDEYAVGALKVAVANMDGSYTVEVIHENMTQARVVEQLRSKKIDVFWLASSKQDEDALVPIRFPMLKGLLGYRVNIINPKNEAKFAAVRTKEDLKALSFGQGYGWPDVNILRSNDLTVVVTSKYENLFPMVEGGRFDGFPRGVLEPWVELRNHPNLGLTVDPHILMIYPLPFYFFVDNDNQALGAKIHQGLERALANGQFDAYFYNHDMVKSALEKAKLQDRKAIFDLRNPTLSQETPLNRADYWFDIKALQ